MPARTRRFRQFAEGGLSLLVGTAVTGGLFAGMAHFEQVGPPPEEEDFEDMRLFSMPLELPPPLEDAPAPAAIEATPVPVDLQIGSFDSPVTIAVVPPDIATLQPPIEEPPPARIDIALDLAALRPPADAAVDTKRIYQQTEVERVPTVLSRTEPRVPAVVRRGASALRVTLVLVLDTRGRVTNVRVLRSSGNPQFDKIIVENVKSDWTFTPAIKDGRNVRVQIQQTITVKWSGSTLFGY